jgi:chromosome partitioning protein
MYTAAILNEKGGSGKTTTAIALASGLALKGKKVLLADFDAQGHATEWLGGRRGEDVTDQNNLLTWLMRSDFNLDKILLSSSIPNVDLIPAHAVMKRGDVQLASGAVLTSPAMYLAEKIESMDERWDYFIIDGPPNPGYLVANALLACDGVIMPVVPRYLEISGAAKLFKDITEYNQKSQGHQINLLGVLVVRYRGHANMEREADDILRPVFGDKLFETVIHENIAVSSAAGHKVSIYEYDSNCAGAIDYDMFVDEFLKRVEG